MRGAAGSRTEQPGAGEPVRVTLGQLEVSTDHAANLVAVRSAFREAARVGSHLLVLPEYAAAFDPRGTGPEHAEPLDGPFVTTLRRLSREHGVAVVAGTLVPDDASARAVNAVVAVDRDGVLVGVYRKVHLYDAFGHRESDRLAAGDPAAAPLVLTVGGLRFGVLTCYDLRFPESARRVVDAGADVLVVPAAWAAGPLKEDHWRTLARARAIENTAVVLAVGQAGTGVVGRSVLVGPDGQVGLELGERAELRSADLDPAPLREARELNPSLANRRYAVVPRD
ncbi:carbon-nitrogen hydrolase family protein [Cellulosimicrobium marinum]|uniref:carbon-nitrogen hydrolase family protein n=1 Tax=Cellulosimicrobium marinum TaxID=1638992 RepID=UPI001E55112E|nr:carbon-nitrogen hydrolase family protein [Cellulosimicrobium marinum]MCB7137117.1 carbon-nitrogen hydrolase family protein [Cellulosimicrobium marinum]